MNTQLEKKQYHGGQLKQGSCEQTKQQQVPPTTLYSPSSSPSHEFSFTISLNPSSNNTITAPADKTKPTTPSSHALDLSPADDIFFHGHLLPLHLLSHLPVSPRKSLDSFTLPIKDLSQDQTSNNINNNSKTNDTSNRDNEICDDHEYNKCNGNDLKEELQINIRPKAKSFSLFGRSKGRKENENGDKERQKKKLKFEVSHMLKRYMKMVKPILSMKNNNRRENGGEIHKQSHSFSGNVSLRHDDSFETRFSAPASMWTSPSNSGVLVGKRNVSSSPSSDSTMEELQAAIQAAIAHCKSSIAVEDKIKCHD